MRLLANEAKASTASIEASVRKEAQAAIALQRQRSGALISEWKRETRESEKEQQAQKRAAESLQRQRSAAIISSWRQQERERVNIARQAQAQIEANERAAQQRRAAFFSGAVGGATALVGAFAVNELRQAGAAMLDYASKLETTKIAFTTMLGSAEAAEQHLKELQQFALKTPFQFIELVEASQRMQALGFSAQQVVPLLNDVGNAVAAAGGGSYRLELVVKALSDVQSKGKLASQEIRQFAESGISAYRILESQLHKSHAELVKMVEAGQISSAVFIDAFQKFSQQNFGGLMEAQSKTFAGAMSNIKDALLQTSATAFEPLYKRLSETAQRIGDLAINSKEFRDDMKSVGGQLVTVWDGAVGAFYVFRDVFRIGSAVIAALVISLTETFMALTFAVGAVMLEFLSLSRLLRGDLSGAVEAHEASTRALTNAMESLTRAATSQQIVAQQLARAWNEAGDRAVIATAKMIAAASWNPDPGVAVSDMVGAGILRKKQSSVATGGKGKKGKTERDTFLQDAVKDAELAERRVLAQLTSDVRENKDALDSQIRDIEEFTRRAIDLADQRLAASLKRIDDEQLGIDSALAKRRIKQKEYDDKNEELSLRTLEAIEKKNAEIADLEDARDKKLATQQLAARNRSVQIADEASERLIRIIKDRVERETLSEAEGERQISVIIAEGYKRKKEALEFEQTLYSTTLDRREEITDQFILLEGERADAAVQASQRITDALKKEAQARHDALFKPVSGAIEGAARKVAKTKGWEQTPPPEIGIWDATLSALEERMQTFHAASQLYIVGAFHNMADAAQDAIEAWILYGGSLGKALKQALAAELAHVAAQAMIQSLLHAAYALGALAFGNFASAAKHGIAAAKFAGVAALAGVAARTVAGSSFQGSNSGSGGGGASDRGSGGGGHAVKNPTTPAGPTSIGRGVGSQPTETIVFHVKGAAVVEEFVRDFQTGGRTRIVVKNDGTLTG